MKRLYIGITGVELDEANRRLIQDAQPAGVVLFGRNIRSADQVRELNRELHRLGLLVAVDQENHRVNRLRDFVRLPTIAEVKAGGDAVGFGKRVGETLRELGFDLDFAPVVDLDYGATDNALQERCWGCTAAEVVKWAGGFIDGLQAEGVAACPKHFPGLGRATKDSHEELPVIPSTDLTEDLRPFEELLPRCRYVMVGHARYTALEEAPASLSRLVITGLLRDRLGFRGTVLTDDLEMKAIRHVGEAAKRAVAAGADGVLVCHDPAKIREAHAALSG